MRGQGTRRSGVAGRRTRTPGRAQSAPPSRRALAPRCPRYEPGRPAGRAVNSNCCDAQCHTSIGRTVASADYVLYLPMRCYGELSELAEGARLEIVYAPKAHPGFESPTLRQNFHTAPYHSLTIGRRAPYGGVAEWLNAAVSKTVWPFRVTRVRIPPPPP